jgi:transcriptional regulator with PAS, ATPase and Fis domain
MLYLLYLRSGFIKKFPLTKKTIIIGRSSENDLILNESFVSQKHAKINVFKKHIIVEDLGSTNGIFIDSTKIHKVKIELNQYFRIGYVNIFLKEGNVQDFVISKKVQPVLNKISKMFTTKGDKTQEAIKLLYTEPLIEMLQIGFKLEEFIDIFRFAKKVLNQVLKKGNLVLITRENNNNIIESKWNYNQKYYPYILEILQFEDVFQKTRINKKIADSFSFCSFPFISSTRNLLLIYLLKTEKSIPSKSIEFLKDLSVEISIIDSLIEQNKIITEKEIIEVPEIITNNQILLNFLSKCKKIAVSDLFVIIKGETGTGKELVAKFIHSKSKRNSGNFVALNCAAIPENLMEAELFGHEKGAFTDAKNQRKGKLELSSGGTLVLDEIGNMPLSLQKKLLRAIQEEHFYRIGGNQPIKVDLRIICLTHSNILELLKKEAFREDLYYRLNHVTLKILPLRERKEDIVPLINHFVKIFSKESQITIKGFSQESIKALEIYDWPGNVRELQNEIKKIISLSDYDDIIDLSMLKDAIIHFYNQRKKPSEEFKETEKEKILKLLKKHRWNKTLVSREMKISRTALYEKLGKYKMK